MPYSQCSHNNSKFLIQLQRLAARSDVIICGKKEKFPSVFSNDFHLCVIVFCSRCLFSIRVLLPRCVCVRACVHMCCALAMSLWLCSVFGYESPSGAHFDVLVCLESLVFVIQKMSIELQNRKFGRVSFASTIHYLVSIMVLQFSCIYDKNEEIQAKLRDGAKRKKTLYFFQVWSWSC